MHEMLLQLKGVSVHYGGVKALNAVDIAIDEGEVVALMGPNGAGKSTVLKAIFGLAPLNAGKVLWHETPFTPLPHAAAKRGIAFVPQGHRVFAHLTVEENLEMGGFTVKDKTELKRRVEEAMSFFPALRQKRHYAAGALSGGEQQMLALARGLIASPTLLLLDEPSLGLAPKIVKEVFAKIKEIAERHKIAIMIVEHNIRSVLGIAQRAYVLNRGTVAFTGTSQKLKDSHILERVFLGKV